MLNKQKNMKEVKNKSRGITLIALVITIIVLLILAGVSIATLTGDNGILTKAQKSVEENEKTEVKDKAQLDIIEWQTTQLEKGQNADLTDEIVKGILEEKDYVRKPITGDSVLTVKNGYSIKISDLYTNSSSSGGDTPKEGLQPGDTASTTVKDNYTDTNGKKATIPEGFKVSDVDGETNVDTGLVVINPEDSSEFVWVPVDDPSEMYGTLADGTKAGKLYTSWTATTSDPYNWTETEGVMNITDATGYREPDIVIDYDNNTEYLNLMNNILETIFANPGDFKSYMQSEYNKMVESIIKYKGFYVGRYETSLEGNMPKSIKGATSATAETSKGNMWYGLYAKQQLYSTNSVKGQMIWGSQYDAMMKWMQKNNIDVSSTTPIVGATKNTGDTTGTVENDKLNNIYDLLGNRREWTSEAYFTNTRVIRGGSYSNSDSPSNRGFNFTSSVLSYYGSREALYILYTDH